MASFAPGMNNQAARSADDTFHLITAEDGGGVIGEVFGGVETAIEEERGGENERNGKQSGEEVLEDFDFLVGMSAAIQKNGDGESEEKNQAEEDEHGVQIEGRINLADIGEKERTGEEEGSLDKQAAAEYEFGGDGGQATSGTLIGIARCATIHATSHEVKYTAALRTSREFCEQILEMLLALLFGKRKGDTHA